MEGNIRAALGLIVHAPQFLVYVENGVRLAKGYGSFYKLINTDIFPVAFPVDPAYSVIS